MKLTQISVIKQLMSEHDTAFKKSLGQNFLTSEAVPRKIAEAARDSGCGCVLEIGPGIGTLTQELCEVCEKVCAVEIDSSLIPILGETLADYSNVEVINADFMKLELGETVERCLGGGGFAVCANLPYYITTPIIMKLLEGNVRPSAVIVMVQREVADRLCAAPGTPEYGAVTASVAWYGRAEKLFAVPAGCFTPRPKVDSAVIRVTPRTSPPAPVSDADMRRVIRGAFAQRRKTLVNSLGVEYKLPRAALLDAVVFCGLPADVRGERLSVPELAALAGKLSALEANT